jgi:predicted lipoprotein with Yx(FWY)xxD motif
MRQMIAGLAAVLLATSAAIAAGKTMDTSAGKVYVDDKGMTLYMLDKDAANTSTCNDKCAAVWPPYKAAADAKAEGEWKIVDRKDGTKMWAYDGHPLYTFVKDKKPGDATGEGVKDDFGVWHVAKAS